MFIADPERLRQLDLAVLDDGRERMSRIAASAFAVAAVFGYLGSRWLQVKEMDAHFSDLPEPLEGMRIVQISDLHLGPHTSRRHLAKVVRKVREARPDLIAITGDQVDDYAGDVAWFAEAFAGLFAPLRVAAAQASGPALKVADLR